MKLSAEILSDFAETKAILEELAAESKKDIEWSNRATTKLKHAKWTAPEVFNNESFLNINNSAFGKYKTAIEVLDNAISNQEISEGDLQTLENTQIPKLVETSKRLKQRP